MHRRVVNTKLKKAVIFALPLVFAFLLFHSSFSHAQNNTCSDGTELGKCSEVKGAPWYCNYGGELIEMCSICGCGGDWICGQSGSFCCDNECNGVCSVSECNAQKDPDCGCLNFNGCCGIGCEYSNDTDCDILASSPLFDCSCADEDSCYNLLAPLNPNQQGVCFGSKQEMFFRENYSSLEYYETDEISCDGLDNDCDGVVDEGCNCIDGSEEPCGSNTGECQSGIMTCANGVWSDCQDSIGPSDEICDGLDNDCDGIIDNNLNPPLNDNQKGVCSDSQKICAGADGWINDYSNIPYYETTEISCDGLDNDCDGRVDEDMGQTTCGLGICEHTIDNCQDGTLQECNPFEGAKEEICGNDIDEDCNGKAEECPVECGDDTCSPGENCENCPADCGECLDICGDGYCDRGCGEDHVNCPSDCESSCGDGYCDTSQGECSNCSADCGIEDCCGNGVCDSNLDENNENCSADCKKQDDNICTFPISFPCILAQSATSPFSSPTPFPYTPFNQSSSDNICSHECNIGDPAFCDGNNIIKCLENCDNDYYNDLCIVENCADSGQICSQGACIKNCQDLDQDGYDDCDIGEAGDDGKVKDCDDNNPAINPGAEEVCDGIDNNCNNTVDENCECINGEEKQCGETNIGACRFGIQTCENGTWGDCQNSINPTDEICDGLDNDCDGVIDEDLGQTTCGLGICEHTIDNCQDGILKECNPFEGAVEEICGNGIDEDCDGVDKECTCVPEWSCGDWSVCDSGEQYRTCDDVNQCGIEEGRPDENRACSVDCIDECSAGEKGCLYSGSSWTCEEAGDGDVCLEKIIQHCDYRTKEVCNIDTGACEVINTLYSPINSPSNNQEFSFGQDIYFSAYAQNGVFPYTYKWESDINGLIGEKNYFSTSSLAIGTHKITLTVNDAEGTIYQNSINIVVKNGMVLNLPMKDEGGLNYYSGRDVWFSVWVVGGKSPYSYNWESDKDGFLSDKEYFQKNNLSIGVHKISITVNDSLGEIVTENFYLQINESRCIDSDGDGYGINENDDSSIWTDYGCPNYGFDCDDNNPAINPGQKEDCYNGIDDDCNGLIDECRIDFSVVSPTEDANLLWGSEVNFVLDFESDVSGVYARIYDGNNNLLKTVYLYDNGKNNDGVEGDGRFGGSMLNLLSNGAYNLKFEARVIGSYKYYQLNKEIVVNSVNTPACKTVVDNVHSDDKLDLVFIADRYTDFNVFANKVKCASDYLFTIKPFDAQKEKVNIHRIDSPVNLYCETYGSTIETANKYCNHSTVYAIESLCPSDSPVVFTNKSGRSWAFLNGFAVVFGGSSWVTVHELGHSFAGLYDEYVSRTGTGGTTSRPNCDHNSDCGKWSDISDVGCYSGCTYSNWYRPTYSSLMRTSNDENFGPVNINHINSIFENYK